ncbi:hypothetical protein ACJX0J_013009 [Zea mays]
MCFAAGDRDAQTQVKIGWTRVRARGNNNKGCNSTKGHKLSNLILIQPLMGFGLPHSTDATLLVEQSHMIYGVRLPICDGLCLLLNILMVLFDLWVARVAHKICCIFPSLYFCNFA